MHTATVPIHRTDVMKTQRAGGATHRHRPQQNGREPVNMDASTALGIEFADSINDECVALGADLRSEEQPMFGGARRHTWHHNGAIIVITWPATDVP